MQQSDFFVRFWGVRGSLPVPGPETLEFGGNSPCLEIRCGPHILIFDAGSGIRSLGNALCDEGIEDIDLLFSHCHYDHICGLPFFAPFFCKGRSINLWSGHLAGVMSTQEMVSAFMTEPFFPVSPDFFVADMSYKDFTAGDILMPKSGITVKTGALNHPNGCIGYRVEWNDKAICYISDTEHREGQLDQTILNLIHGADIVIYDATYTDEEYPEYRGYGHSTWQEGIRLCEQANAKQLVIFHHRPRRNDEFLRTLEHEARTMRPGTVVAREGMVLKP